MNWNCPICGTHNGPELRACQANCGYSRMPARVVLESVVTGRCKCLHVRTCIGRRVLRALDGDGTRFASEEQFEIWPDESAGEWRLEHVTAAINPTFYDGSVVNGSPLTLANDGIISIGPKELPLRVRLEDA